MHDETLIQVAINLPDEVLDHHFDGCEHSASEYLYFTLLKAKEALISDFLKEGGRFDE